VNRIYFDRDFDPTQRLADWLNESPGSRALDCSYRPAFDVVETTTGIDVIVDLPGVAPEAVSVVFSAGTLVIAGHKRASACESHHAAFHLAERTFGAFTCVLRVAMAIDASRARATLADRRGREIQIPVAYSGHAAR
jgi:HSP20 family molecular chaperone IbpA